ncbi:hypothetical protein E3Q06_02545 [Wallemia mellicola]|nr:hypothetical protein E3Q21_02558 [Wallemia mellicola]TIB87216.1 hypothetical protein E3Q20_02551 [Wallemia mellicola]TIC39869.1 hypothetical protein E3Q07_02593 [Wallemia mellicola]TIC48156.1 hypothetical protein E3Q06_02545 [Wallemia mellicola]
MTRKRKSRRKEGSRRKARSKQRMEVTIKPSLGDMNPDILMQIIDSAHEIGIYDIGHTLAQVNRYLASIVKLYSRLKLDVFSNTGFTQLYNSGLFSLINDSRPLKNLSLIGLCQDFRPHIPVEAEEISIDNTWDNSLVPQYAVICLYSRNTRSCKRLSLKNVTIERDTYDVITNCKNLKLEYTDKCPRGFNSQHFRANRSGLSGTVLVVTSLFNNLKSFTIINSTDQMFFSTCTYQVRGFLVSTMDELEELHLVRVNTFICKIRTCKLKKLKLEGCTDLENQFRKLNPRLRFLSLAHSRFGRITRLVRYDLLRCVELQTLDLSYADDEFVDIFVKDKKYLRGLKELVNINFSGTNVEGQDVLSCVRRHYPDFEQLKAINCPNITIEEQLELIENVPLCQVDINQHVNRELVFENPHPSAYLYKRSRWLYIGHHGSYYRQAQYTEIEFPQVMPPPPNEIHDTPTEELARYEWRRCTPPSPPVTYNSIVDENTSRA